MPLRPPHPRQRLPSPLWLPTCPRGKASRDSQHRRRVSLQHAPCDTRRLKPSPRQAPAHLPLDRVFSPPFNGTPRAFWLSCPSWFSSPALSSSCHAVHSLSVVCFLPVECLLERRDVGFFCVHPSTENSPWRAADTECVLWGEGANPWGCRTTALPFTRNLGRQPGCPVHTTIKKVAVGWKGTLFVHGPS